MAVAKNYLEVAGDTVFIFFDGDGEAVHHSELINLMTSSRSLAVVWKRFRASRSNLIETLDHFGYDFDRLLNEQFREGYRDAALAKLHRVDPKWIADKRQALGFPNAPGRTRVEFSVDEIMRAYDAAGSFVGAAALLGINRKTFKKLYLWALENGLQIEHRSSASAERLAALQEKARALGITTTLTEAELKAFMDDQWGEGD
ncbi:hypothetical protein SAMN05444149_107142 [Pseudosulfitobacter pseudonitzschiae]|uniref:Uncharacterized protein n=1 Tax=Pseudosulfitobacter pseudonitzschiae TaxID=1402135 RepID=A0A073IZ09_9RHOB|nr:hypothetical protein [Pseudosulfitobacter pseudonitzschiae]KEJ94964.1 hypothetical protein SUH3_24605 [Pseudosulfitobacter pseudonitzschiae]QKS07435.1 hypothetical protein HT745_02545 [Pseudosulfitobacter pseudonitzschiae]SHF98019.1 hypothetical protein SAMN05444149_107142 [Pseudosulfitobacter pseudonitzschiae]